MLKLLIVALFSFGIAPGPAFAAPPVARINALASGVILLNGKPTTSADLDEALADLKRRGGLVWYYRENAAGEPSPQAMQAIQLVVKHQLPISMSTKADFSNVVDANGLTRAREP
jgi:hypothetical protein